jgi:hypothetical protein
VSVCHALRLRARGQLAGVPPIRDDLVLC